VQEERIFENGWEEESHVEFRLKRKMNGNYKRQTRGEENAHTHPGVSSSHQ
jgi:hypothetical protein